VQLPDRSTLDAIAYGIAYPLLGDPTTARGVADGAVGWVHAHADVAAALPAAWLAATTVERCLATPPAPGRLVDDDRRALVRLLAAQPVGARVAFALAGLCGYDRSTVAALTRRPESEVEALLAPSTRPPTRSRGSPVERLRALGRSAPRPHPRRSTPTSRSSPTTTSRRTRRPTRPARAMSRHWWSRHGGGASG
jgi:hypothetical protein